MRSEGVSGGELFGNLAGQVVGDAAVLEQAGELVEFGLRGGGEFHAFQRERGLFGVTEASVLHPAQRKPSQTRFLRLRSFHYLKEPP